MVIPSCDWPFYTYFPDWPPIAPFIHTGRSVCGVPFERTSTANTNDAHPVVWNGWLLVCLGTNCADWKCVSTKWPRSSHCSFVFFRNVVYTIPILCTPSGSPYASTNIYNSSSPSDQPTICARDCKRTPTNGRSQPVERIGNITSVAVRKTTTTNLLAHFALVWHARGKDATGRYIRPTHNTLYGI